MPKQYSGPPATWASSREPAIRASRAARSKAGALLVGAAAIGALAVVVRARARAAERRHPPVGRFLDIDGIRLHYLDRGRGQPVVLLHGNGSLIQDFLTSGLVERLSERFRVLAFDRPGFGYSDRPRDRLWTPAAQAELLATALQRLGVEQPVVVGHSWGTLVALALGLAHPSAVRGLVLVSGYYYPTLRLDVPLFAPPAVPVIGDVLRFTIAPLMSALLLPRLIRRLFEPAAVPIRFRREFPHELLLRPSQLRAAGADSLFMIPAAMAFRRRYQDLEVPVAIVTGAEDRAVDEHRQAERLHGELPGSGFVAVPGAGHMVHHLAPDRVIEAVEGVLQAYEHGAEGPPWSVPLARAEHLAGRPVSALEQHRG